MDETSVWWEWQLETTAKQQGVFQAFYPGLLCRFTPATARIRLQTADISKAWKCANRTSYEGWFKLDN